MKIHSYYFSFLLGVLMSSYSCSAVDCDGETPLIKSNQSNPSYLLEIIAQLNEVLGSGDIFEFNQNFNATNALVFVSVHDFIVYKRNHQFYINYDVSESSMGIHSTKYRDVYNRINSIDIGVKQKLESEDHDQLYGIQDIETNMSGDLLGRGWEHLYYYYEIFNGNAVINLYGINIYFILIDSVGIEYHDYKHYKIIIDIHTGYPLSILEVDE